MNDYRPVDDVLSKMRDFCSGLSADFFDLDKTLEDYMAYSEEERKGWADYLIARGMSIIQFNKQDGYYYYFMTFLLHATQNKQLYKKLLNHCIQDDALSKETKFFLYFQFTRYTFVNSDVIDAEIDELYDDLYKQIYDEYRRELKNECGFIPREERNKDFVLVITGQMLGMNHGPTKTLLDRCFVLEEYLKKKVYIINTADVMTSYGAIPVFRWGVGNYMEELKDYETIAYKDKKFGYFQCDQQMPNTSVIKEIMSVIRSEKPYFILTIGGSSIVSDLCSNIVSTIVITLGPCNRTMTYGQFQAIGRKVIESDRVWMKKHSLPEDHIIESLFTSAFKEQTHQYTRKDLGLPEDRFIAILVGGRLDQEIDTECIDLLLRLMEAGIYIAFIGGFKGWQDYAAANEIFKRNSVNMGFQDDILAVDECCDLYINPKRLGGGTSIAEALYKGLPAVTLDYGDVGVGAGPDFHVVDYEDMYKQVLRYANDREYYNRMSQRARERAEQLMDSKAEFIKIIKKAEASDSF